MANNTCWLVLGFTGDGSVGHLLTVTFLALGCSNQLGGQDAMAKGCCSAMGAFAQQEKSAANP